MARKPARRLPWKPARPDSSGSRATQPSTQPQSGVFLGIGGVPMTPELASSLNLPQDTNGVLIEEVTADSPAAKANLQKNDVVTALDGQAVSDVQGCVR